MFKVLYFSAIGISSVGATGGLTANSYILQKNIFENHQTNRKKLINTEIESLEKIKILFNQKLAPQIKELNSLWDAKQKYSHNDMQLLINNLNNQILELTSKISSVSQEELTLKIATIKQNIETIKSEISTLASGIKTLSSSITNLETEITELNKQNNAKNNEIASALKDKNTKIANYDSTSADIASINQDIQSQTTSENAAKSSLDNKTNELTSATNAFNTANTNHATEHTNNQKRIQADKTFKECQKRKDNLSKTSGRNSHTAHSTVDCSHSQQELEKWRKFTDAGVHRLNFFKNLAQEKKQAADRAFKTSQTFYNEEKSKTEKLTSSLQEKNTLLTKQSSEKDSAEKKYQDLILAKQEFDKKLLEKTTSLTQLMSEKDTKNSHLGNKSKEQTEKANELLKLQEKSKLLSQWIQSKQNIKEQHAQESQKMNEYLKLVAKISSKESEIKFEQEKIKTLIFRTTELKQELEKIQESEFQFEISKIGQNSTNQK